MSTAASPRKTRKVNPTKPKKPYPDFPLFPHASGYWAKKIRGKHHYFGKWNDWRAALATYQAECDDLYAGREPHKPTEGGLQLRFLLNRFLNDKQSAVDAGDVSAVHFMDLKRTCQRLVDEFGRTRIVTDIRASEFISLRTKLLLTWAPTTLLGEAARVQSIFNYAYKKDLVEHPLKAPRAFERPSSRAVRQHRQSTEKKFFPASQINRMLAAAMPPLKAFILLAVNCGFGNCDCARVPRSAFDLEQGWVDFPRPKTGIERRCPLWKETIEAVREAMALNPSPKSEEWSELAFLTSRGRSWCPSPGQDSILPVFQALQKLKSVNSYRPGVGFYALRHTFATVAEGARDDTAKEFIMGHVDNSIATAYREHIDDVRLRGVTEHVHTWLQANEGDEIESRV